MEISTKLDPLAAQYAGKVPLVVNQVGQDMTGKENGGDMNMSRHYAGEKQFCSVIG